jgi:hypothetical protein
MVTVLPEYATRVADVIMGLLRTWSCPEAEEAPYSIGLLNASVALHKPRFSIAPRTKTSLVDESMLQETDDTPHTITEQLNASDRRKF